MSYKTRTIKSNMLLENYSLTNLLNSQKTLLDSWTALKLNL